MLFGLIDIVFDNDADAFNSSDAEHVAAKLPCDDDDNNNVMLLIDNERCYSKGQEDLINGVL